MNGNEKNHKKKYRYLARKITNGRPGYVRLVIDDADTTTEAMGLTISTMK